MISTSSPAVGTVPVLQSAASVNKPLMLRLQLIRVVSETFLPQEIPSELVVLLDHRTKIWKSKHHDERQQ
jgi:hypothetical protein